ncbi:MAG: TrkA family potassium uptake protein [Gammaproteobacteria bacterium]|nr:TrkA family potassium uptake protein [Gammaproteobacteria bacterium]MCW8840232.1 TrkA family potassium uptake protein [Gammaproteobacteria bacterium]MCW8958889.1 TrkA family potassium uptake protein [Gammaproteobacteria bacterium]MCW8972652.1 TrkA family potassium uptake protein [Gammaproteobacteria bacterium]MCW8992383.1 TrkA family potassium uptake protein [Gammaproteobacteria bacterium]
MRAVLIGAGSLGVMTARLLLRHRHEVVLIDTDKERLDAVAEELDCGMICGDGSRPALLREADPEHTDHLFCLTNNDQTNILASLVGRSLGFPHIVTRIEDPQYEHICLELGLENPIIPARTIGRLLSDLFEGRDPLELSTMIRDEARVFSFVARDEDQARVEELPLPEDVRVICIYRSGTLTIPKGKDKVEPGDEVVLITHSKDLEKLKERWAAKP